MANAIDSKKELVPLKDLGWSQDSIAYVINCTRPALKKWFEVAEGLTLEQEAKLNTLLELEMTYKAFVKQAVARHAFDTVWKPAYLKLASNETK